MSSSSPPQPKNSLVNPFTLLNSAGLNSVTPPNALPYGDLVKYKIIHYTRQNSTVLEIGTTHLHWRYWRQTLLTCTGGTIGRHHSPVLKILKIGSHVSR